MMNKIAELSKDLRKKTERLAELSSELEGSLAIKGFFPEAFKHGGITSCIYGNPRTKWTYRITRGDGSKFEWPTGDVPKVILERYVDHMKDEVSRRQLRAVVLKNR